MVCTRIDAREPSFFTVRDAERSVGDTRRVIWLTTFPDLSITVKTTEAIPVSPAFGENLMRPLNELIPAVTDVREFPGLLLGSPSLL